MRTLSIIIPVYNEERFIVKVVEKVLGADTLGLKKEIVIVDDASTDKTVEKIKQFTLSFPRRRESRLDPRVKPEDDKYVSIRAIYKKKNEGKGAALKAGFAKATGDVLMVQDADEEYSVKDYPALISPFINEKTQVVYGSRNKKRENFHNRYSYLIYYWGGLALTWIINFLFGTQLTDQATGYKLFSSKVKLLLLKPKENRFSYEVAITALLAKSGYTIIEVPIHYKPRSISEGKKINALDFIKSVIVAVKYVFSS